MRRVDQRRHRSLLALTALCVALAAIACSGDPEARKQRFFESGNHYFERGDYRPAIIQYKNAVAVDARFGAARAKLAESYLRAGDAASALSEFVRAADVLSDDFDLQIKAGALLLTAGRANDALSKADRALVLKPTDITAHILRGNALAGLKSFDEALAAIEEAIRLDPARGTTVTQKGIIELASGRSKEAERTFKHAIDLAPDSVEAYLALGNYYWALGRPAETEQTFEAALGVKPRDPSANRAMAALTLAMGRTAEAEKYLRAVTDSAGDSSSQIALASYYLVTGRNKDAIAQLTPLAAADRNVPGARQLLARAHALAGDRARANAMVDEALAVNKADLDAQILKGQLLFDEGNRDAALTMLKQAAEAHPTSAEARLLLGQLYLSRGDAVPAEEAFREVLRLNPRIAAAQVELSRLLMWTGRAADSVGPAEAAVRVEPNSINVRLALIRSLLAVGEVARAEKEIAPLLAQRPDVAEVQVLAGVLAMLENKPSGGRVAFERALSSNPNSLEAVAGLIALDLRDNNITAALKRIDDRLTTNSSPEWLLLAAQTYRSAHDLTGAERFLRRAIESDATLLTAYDMLGQLYLSQSRLDEARKEFDTLAAKQSKPVAALTMSGIILQTQGHVAEARKRFESALAIEPRSPVAANNLAWLQAEAGENLDVALQLAQSAVSVSPDTPEITDTLGWIYHKKNLPAQAIQQFERSVNKAPENAMFRYHLGLAYLQAGDIERGRVTLLRALSSKPGAKLAEDIKRALPASGGASSNN